MKKYAFVLLFVFIFLCVGFSDVYAHPGRTDSNGCHTCRSNCAKWGLSYGQYHCHNGGNSSSSARSYVQQYVYGCTDSGSVNYNPRANKDDGSCIKKVYGCTDSNAYNYNPKANVSDNSCVAKVYGCTDTKASNYDKNANINNNLCLYTKYKTSYKKIKYKTKYKYKLFAKNGKILRKGKNGKRKIKEKLTVNSEGEVVEKSIISNKVVVKPITKIVVKK